MKTAHGLHVSFLALLCCVGAVLAQRGNTSLCDYYTGVIFNSNTAANQAALVTLLVNTIFVGNYTKPNVGIATQGILTPANHNGQFVFLLPFFNGSYLSTNTGGLSAGSVNFFDDGGPDILIKSQPALGTSSNQYKMMTHFYRYFGVLLGCSQQGGPSFPAYDGVVSQFSVHKFMGLNSADVDWFAFQAGWGAQSLGFSSADNLAVYDIIHAFFGFRCAPNNNAIPALGFSLRSICTAADCPLDPNPRCDLYPAITVSPPSPASTSPASSSSTGSSVSAATSATIAAGTSAAGASSATNSSPPSTSGSNSVALGVGIGLSLAVILIACGLGVFWFIRRRKRKAWASGVAGATAGAAALDPKPEMYAGSSYVPSEMPSEHFGQQTPHELEAPRHS